MAFVIGGLVSLLLAFAIGATSLGLAGFVMFGAIAGGLGDQRVGSVETFYWILLAALIVLIALVFLGLNVPSFLVFLPVMMMLSRLVTVWTLALYRRFAG